MDERAMNIRLDALSKIIEEQNEKIIMLAKKIDKSQPEDRMSIVVFSNDLDKAIAAFILATGAAALGMEVNMFFTFWGTAILKNPKKMVRGKTPIQKMFAMMLPNGSEKLKLSKMHMMGMGTAMIRGMMKNQNISSLEDLINLAEDMDSVKISICEMSASLMGIKKEECMKTKKIELVGAASFLTVAVKSKVTLFI